jgi:hypothetical protein
MNQTKTFLFSKLEKLEIQTVVPDGHTESVRCRGVPLTTIQKNLKRWNLGVTMTKMTKKDVRKIEKVIFFTVVVVLTATESHQSLFKQICCAEWPIVVRVTLERQNYSQSYNQIVHFNFIICFVVQQLLGFENHWSTEFINLGSS